MPSLGSHLATARILADRLAHTSIDGDRGSFYIGATAPDIRVLTRRDRIETHFFSLDRFESQDAIATMFDQHPGLSDAVTLDVPTRAFMAGFLTHLVMDQQYIERVYRLYFGADAWKDDPSRGNVLDRVLQYEMDRRAREQTAVMGDVRDVLTDDSAAASIEFIEAETLGRWVEVVRDVTSQPATWDRFPRMISNHLKRAGYSEDEIEDFSRDVPQILAETMDHVTEVTVSEFLMETVDRSLERLREYLK
jgi:hypothetical protein